jgi:hypothetical protein
MILKGALADLARSSDWERVSVNAVARDEALSACIRSMTEHPDVPTRGASVLPPITPEKAHQGALTEALTDGQERTGIGEHELARQVEQLSTDEDECTSVVIG